MSGGGIVREGKCPGVELSVFLAYQYLVYDSYPRLITLIIRVRSGYHTHISVTHRHPAFHPVQGSYGLSLHQVLPKHMSATYRKASNSGLKEELAWRRWGGSVCVEGGGC